MTLQGAEDFRLTVLNPGGRDPEQQFRGVLAPGEGAHPPINFHAFAACTHGAFHQNPRRSIRALAGAGGASHLFRLLIPLKIKDGIFVCHRMSNLESLSARANGMCHRVIISQRCWLRANFVTRRANQSPSLIWMDITRVVYFP